MKEAVVRTLESCETDVLDIYSIYKSVIDECLRCPTHCRPSYTILNMYTSALTSHHPSLYKLCDGYLKRKVCKMKIISAVSVVLLTLGVLYL
jgi:hypothetical protein